MSFLDELANCAASPASVWHQFVVAHRPGADDYYLFVEGRLDGPFYASALRLVVAPTARILTFRCKGKAGVLRALRDVRESHPQCTRCLFFVDKDLDPVPSGDEPALFCTEVYSIENYLVVPGGIDIVWENIWTLASADERLPVLRSRFEESLRVFHRKMLPLMSWAILVRQNGEKPNLGNVRLSEVMSMADLLPKRKSGALVAVKADSSCVLSPKLLEWARLTRSLKGQEPKAVVRGKFELWFLCQFLGEVFSALRGASGERPQGGLQLGQEALARSLIGRIAPSRQLAEFTSAAVARGKTSHCVAVAGP